MDPDQEEEEDKENKEIKEEKEEEEEDKEDKDSLKENKEDKEKDNSFQNLFQWKSKSNFLFLISVMRHFVVCLLHYPLLWAKAPSHVLFQGGETVTPTTLKFLGFLAHQPTNQPDPWAPLLSIHKMPFLIDVQCTLHIVHQYVRDPWQKFQILIFTLFANQIDFCINQTSNI